MTYDTVLLDLDGTIVDSAPGILGSLKLTLADLELPEAPLEVLKKFIGPPIHDSFVHLFGLTRAESEHAVDRYRVHYRGGLIDEYTVFDGMPDLIRAVAAAPGVALALATSKPESSARHILEQQGLAEFFDVIAGASEDEKVSEKAQVITLALERLEALGLSHGSPVMVGDREHDVLGAQVHGIPAVRVLWGYGEDAESAGAVATAATPAELQALLLG